MARIQIYTAEELMLCHQILLIHKKERYGIIQLLPNTLKVNVLGTAYGLVEEI